MHNVEPQTNARRKLLMAYRAHFLSRTFRETVSNLPAAFFLTDPERTPDPIATIENLPAHTGVIYRHFGLEDRFKIGKEIKEACKHKNLLFFISRDEQLERFLEPDGVHWPKSQLPVFRKSGLRRAFNTSSAHSFSHISKAQNLGLDACFLSAIFPSNSPSAPSAMGNIRLRTLSSQSKIQLYGLGGVNVHNAGSIAKHTGLAAVSNLF
ncbi:thiamine phosphate synthase [Hirschia maritima]|uniref:thiamine phosphate synthase n=1 Tax=Hirschia maritima TaxID=1121961 RepID=UPI000367429D|nr:thiamine phosphate synthase [Hirschia maritima]